MPKNNLYQSLHTAVIALDGKPLEIQIRTHEMHQVSEVGIAAALALQGGHQVRPRVRRQARLAAPAHGLAARRRSDATEFVEGVKLDIFQDQVFVFTPKGDIKDLPAGATPLDFAYRIHTDVGHRTIGAKVNNRLVPLDYRLKNGDIVEIVTTKAAHGPSRDWLNIVRTEPRPREDPPMVQAPGARREHRPRPRVARPRAAPPGADLDRGGRAGQDRSRSPAAQLRPIDDFFAAVGYGAVGAQSVVMRLGVVDDASEAVLPTVAPPPAGARAGGVRVKGVGDLLVRFARCCHPIPGDPIVGFITRGKGVTVHLPTCPTVLNEREVERLIDVEWEAAPPRPTRSRSASRRTTGPACSATSPRSWPRTRSTSWPRTCRSDRSPAVVGTLGRQSPARRPRAVERRT